ncbi:hypothetical protein E2C01_021373 [Portunus trituberculatus]|uniref:Uncharacterized protein n=1 Tax=Portunus trituberculatus TaxID=210409 RepID=A0A5B7E4B1_PORTR|nr:hypothetical protein [Portunus trituberculatus]
MVSTCATGQRPYVGKNAQYLQGVNRGSAGAAVRQRHSFAHCSESIVNLHIYGRAKEEKGIYRNIQRINTYVSVLREIQGCLKSPDTQRPPWYSGTMRALGSKGSLSARVRILSTYSAKELQMT